jgi:hypothetical protein
MVVFPIIYDFFQKGKKNLQKMVTNIDKFQNMCIIFFGIGFLPKILL